MRGYAAWHSVCDMAYRSELNAEIATRIREALGRTTEGDRPTTIADLIAATGLAERTIRRKMTGRHAWTTDELDAIADVLDIPVGSLLSAAAA